MRVKRTVGMLPERDGFLIPDDHLEELRLPSSVVDRTFQRELWEQINDECGTNIDDYEGVSLIPEDLVKAAKIIQQSLNEDKGAPDDYAESLTRAAGLLERSARRHVTVMFSL